MLDYEWTKATARRNALEMARDAGTYQTKDEDWPHLERGIYRAIARPRPNGIPHYDAPGPPEWLRLGDQTNSDRMVSLSASLFRSAGPPWLVDSGASFHAISEDDILLLGISEVERVKPFQIATANGEITCDQIADVFVPPLQVTVKARILPRTPRLLSVGMLCSENGFSFVWRANKGPHIWCSRGSTP